MMRKLKSLASKLWSRVSASVQIAHASFYDAVRFYRHSGVVFKPYYPVARRAEITKLYHMIEKGLALPAPRPGFGEWSIRNLCWQLTRALNEGSRDREIQLAVDALAGYVAFNDEKGGRSSELIEPTLALAATKGITPSGDPVKAPTALGLGDPAKLIDFITSRHSIRCFSGKDVPDIILQNAARAGQAAPCVCNRQASKVYFFRDPELRTSLLACQNGNRGFGDITPVVALVTVDLHQLLEPAERYQGWIDGGLFAMNLLLGVHAQGYGACCLNWSATPAQDKALRKLNVIPANESVIMMIAIGAPPEDFVVARSGRRDVDEVMTII